MENRLKEENLVKELKYIINENDEYLIIKNPATLELGRYLYDMAPKTYRILGCPLSSALASLIIKHKKTALIANFQLRKNSIEVRFMPAEIEATKVLRFGN